MPETYQLEYLHVYSGTSAIPTATVRLRIERGSARGRRHRRRPGGRGLQSHLRGHEYAAKLLRYDIRAVTSGTEAMGEVTVQLEMAASGVGRGASTDVIEASAKAYVDGLNKLAGLS